MYEDNDDFPIKCPHCAHEFFEKVGSIKAGRHTICPELGCGNRIAHPTEQFAFIMSNEGRDARRDYFRRFLRLTKIK